MKVLLENDWSEGFLDYHRQAEECRIRVLAFRNLDRLTGLYFVRSNSLRLVWNYFLEIGLRDVIRKILSRSNERSRNSKYISCGFGRIIEPGANSGFAIGDLVAFIAPAHPACVERLSLPSELIGSVHTEALPFLSPDALLYFDGPEVGHSELDLESLNGWSVFSGESLCVPDNLIEKTVKYLIGSDWGKARRLPIRQDECAKEQTRGIVNALSTLKKRAVLFGYGNYAKVVVIPNIKDYISIECVHEIDPLQIPKSDGLKVKWDTSPILSDEEDYDVFLIAGYHHTHAPLAVEALNRSADVVMEKPIAVDKSQLDELLTAMKKTHGKLFSCFHKRYLPFNDMALADIGLTRGEPVSYHCIVYEVPLPHLHWYRWPNSKSRLVSNGCHWIDHFLFLNDFCRPKNWDLVIADDGTINCSISLENGAFFSMVLTDQGSERIGVQDYIELRAKNTTVKMTNGAEYTAEKYDRIIRKSRINKMQSYQNMYRSIGESILNDRGGDSVTSLEVSSGLILELEKAFNDKLHSTKKCNFEPD